MDVNIVLSLLKVFIVLLTNIAIGDENLTIFSYFKGLYFCTCVGSFVCLIKNPDFCWGSLSSPILNRQNQIFLLLVMEVLNMKSIFFTIVSVD